MSRSWRRSAVGVVAVLVIVVALVSAARGTPVNSSSTNDNPPRSTASTGPKSAAKTPTASSNIPGGPLTSCTGDMISNETVSSGGNMINLTVFHTSTGGGRNCAMAAKIGDTSRRQGPILITLQFVDATSSTWPQLAEHQSSPTAVKSGGVYLDQTENRCVRAEAHFTPSNGGRAVVVSPSHPGCSSRVGIR